MKKVLISVIVAIALICVLAGCEHQHSWSPATCRAPKTCTWCGATEGDVVDHIWQPANCEQPRHCSSCGTTEGGALGHTWVDATCTESKKCTVCGEKTTETTPATGDHKVKKWKIIEKATCTQEGKQTGSCSVCKTELSETLDKIEHKDDGKWVITRSPGIFTSGEQATHCEMCDMVMQTKELVLTMEEKNAIRSAENYLDVMAFSRKGLIKQLKFEGYSEDVATKAVDSIKVDWNEQAAKSAANYIDLMSFSRKSLIRQLKFEGFTTEQAEYGADAVGY